MLRIKGTHNAMKSGMLAADSVIEALLAGRQHDELIDYPQALRASWIGRELGDTRNVKPLLSRFGTVFGSLFCGIEMWLLAAGLRLPGPCLIRCPRARGWARAAVSNRAPACAPMVS